MRIAGRVKELVHYAVGTISGKRDPLLPPPWLHSIGGGEFRDVGEEFLGYFRELGGLKPSDRVLDIGCGTGRMAARLTTYLTTGTYDGFDIVERSLDWLRKAYRRHPSFHFHYADLKNGRYHSGGKAAEGYRFPFEDGSFDFIFLTSVFTHMLTAEVKQYLAEMRRVLAPGGRVFVTAFLVEPTTWELIAQNRAFHSFAFTLPGCRVESAEVPEIAVAYEREDLRGMIQDAGFEIVSENLGKWRGSAGLSWQDILVLAPK